MKLGNLGNLGNFKSFSLKKKDGPAATDDVLIEGTTADQIAEMKRRLADRTRDLEQAQQSINGLNRNRMEDDEEPAKPEPAVGPHPPLQELTLDDIQLADGDEDDLEFDTPTDGGSPVQVVDLSKADAEPEAESIDLGTAPQAAGEAEEESDDDDDLSKGGDDDLKNLFEDDEEEENPLANLINFLPDVTVQELQDDIEEIKSIIKEWQHSK